MAFVVGELKLLLDAMGVIYSVGDDVRDLLIPFVREHGGCTDARVIEEVYVATSLGQCDPDVFWKTVGLDPSIEDSYLERFTLMPGLEQFLDLVQPHVTAIACLSNDVSRWSRKLRNRFGLEDRIASWTISGDVFARKPSPEIYHLCLNALQVAPHNVLFVDDRVKNLDAAAQIGMSTVLFGCSGERGPGSHTTVGGFAELLDLVSNRRISQ